MCDLRSGPAMPGRRCRVFPRFRCALKAYDRRELNRFLGRSTKGATLGAGAIPGSRDAER